MGEWPPVWRVATHSPLDYQGLAAVVRTAVEDRDASVGIKPLKAGDRVVWRAAMTLGGKQLELVVDQETGLVTWYSDGTSTFTAAVDWGSPPPAGQTYTVDAPPGTEVRTTTAKAYRYVATPAEAGRAAGYDPLVSGLAPDGYALKAVATFAAGYRPEGWVHAPGGNADRVIPPSEPAVAQLYTRGLSWFTLEQIGPKAGAFFGTSLGDALQTASPGPALVPADDAAVRRAEGRDGLDLVSGVGAGAVRRRRAPRGVRHRRAHPPGADRVR